MQFLSRNPQILSAPPWWGTASLALDFARSRFAANGAARPLASLITATRASSLVTTGSNGVLAWLGNDVFARTYDANGNPLGLTLEAAATQLETAPNDITSAFWANVRSTDASNTTTAPDGTVTADTLIEDATASASHYVRHTHTKAASAVTYTVSRFVKAKERTKCAIITDDDASAGAVAYFDLDAGVVGTTSAGVFSAVTSGIVPYANGWYRVWMTFTSNTATKLNIGLGITTSLSSLTYSGDGASGIYVWGQNAVASAVLTSPILTLPQLTTAPLDFSNAAWTKDAGVTVSADAAVAPDGTTTMDEITFPASSSNTIYANTSMVTATPHVASVFLKQSDAGGRYVQIAGRTNGFGTTPYVNLDLQTGTLGNGAGTSYGVVPYPNGVYRLYFISTTTGTATNNGGIVINVVDSLTALRFSGRTAAGKIYAWAANLVASSTLISPILTATATATRAAPVATVPTSAFNFNTSEGSMFMRALRFGKRTYGQNIVSIDDGTGNNRITVDFSGAFAGPRVTVITGGVNVGAISSSLESVGSFVNIAVGWAENDIVLYVDGVSIGADTSLTLPTVTTLRFGALGSSATNLDGIVSGYVYYPKRLPNTELQGLTA
jgi:hypothetical protein